MKLARTLIEKTVTKTNVETSETKEVILPINTLTRTEPLNLTVDKSFIRNLPDEIETYLDLIDNFNLEFSKDNNKSKKK